MTGPGPGTGTSRRNLIKAAGAAGVIWSVPVIRPVTAHAAGGVCARVQYDFATSSFVTPTNDDEDITLESGCETCLPDGEVFASTCLCTGQGGWAAAVQRVPPGVLSPSDPVGENTYTVPAGCQIVNATAVLQVIGASGGCLSVQCNRIGSGITINDAYTELTFQIPGSTTEGLPLVYRRIRVLLCCAS